MEEFLCTNWAWDPTLRELAYYRVVGKKRAEAPEYVERLRPVRRVVWYRWAQQPIATATGAMLPSSMSRVVAEYEDGGNLTINEFDRGCAEKIARTIAEAYGAELRLEGAPDGRRGGNLPAPDGMGRLAYRRGRTQVLLDEPGGEIVVTERDRLWGRKRRVYRLTEVRRLELDYRVEGPTEEFTVYAVVSPEEERVPLAGYAGYEGWADPGEWREFTADLARRLGVPHSVSERLPGGPPALGQAYPPAGGG